MSRIFGWIKNHKLTFLLLLIIGYFLYTKFLASPIYPVPYGNGANQFSTGMKTVQGIPLVRPDVITSNQESPPAPEAAAKLVVSDSYLSLLVSDVEQTQNKIIGTAKNLGGYMVESNIANPRDNATSTIVVRVPSTNFQQALALFRSFSVKVITENLSGQDVTDQFIDNQARLDTLNKTKAKFAEILDKATQIQDILNVQRELINLQSQIDAIKGQQLYLEKTAQMAKITIYLSTDEFALPYAPSESWRPGVIFKQAVRSIIGNMRKVGTAVIWIAVYSVIWIPILLILYLLKKKGYLNFLR